MRVLVTAYEYRYGHGSEAGVGWNWVYAMAARGYEVTVITRPENAHFAAVDLQIIPKEIASRVSVVGVGFPTLENLALRQKIFTYPYQYIWQIWTYRVAARLTKEAQYDVVHSLTYGGVRIPCFLGLLKLPLILGPLGGGELAPFRLVAPLGFVAFVKEFARWASNVVTRASPLTWLRFHQATRIFFRTPESFRFFGNAQGAKAAIIPDIGAPLDRPRRRITGSGDTEVLTCIFAGRFLYWKGGELALRGFAHFLQNGGSGTLIMVGDGPCAGRWKRLAGQLGLSSHVRWTGWLERANFLAELSSCHAFLFPSLHDSGGSVIYEALSAGLPVISLNLGGPGYILSEIGLETIPVEGKSFNRVGQLIGEALLNLADRPVEERLDVEAVNAYFKANRWTDLVQRAYSNFESEKPVDGD